MGVIGLWSILDAGARPVRLETLAKKRLAIDASIWIYQFLKAVRDKEGNVLKNAHVVGFFRRICKLLYHGIKPVFVFDGKAPMLKKQTLRNRRTLREGGRVDVVKTAGKILAVQMRKRAIEEKQRQDAMIANDGEEPVPENPVYFDELELKNSELQAQKFKKFDQYHLPELAIDIDKAGAPNDPRIMTQEELQAYARDFEGAEDMNLYDFSKIDYDSDMFTSLPLADQYSILNAARLRSRLRMGLSVEQLTDMFPDRMAFSRFQVERVKERSDLTNRLMNLNGMNEVGAQRIASERGREYVLVKNEGVDGGWSLGVVNNAENPIVIDKGLLEAEDDDDESVEFEDVQIEQSQGDKEALNSEEAIIKRALEETRKAQLSSLRPEGRPRSAKNTSIGRKSTSSVLPRNQNATPLFTRTDTELEEERNIETARGGVLFPVQDDLEADQQLRSSSEAANRLTTKASDTTNLRKAGGFILEDDDEEMETINIRAEPLPADSTTSKPVVQSRQKFELPFARLDMSASLLANNDNPSKEDGNIGKLFKAAERLARDNEEDVSEGQHTPDVPLEATRKADPFRSAETADNADSKAIPDWFSESVTKPEEKAPAAAPQPMPEQAAIITRHVPASYDLTNDEEPDLSSKQMIDLDESARAPTENAQMTSTSALSSPKDHLKKDGSARQTSVVADDAEAANSPDWSEAASPPPEDYQIPLNDVDTPEDTTDQAHPHLQKESSSFVDEQYEQRLLEEEDMMSRMAAEEDEYARFSAQLGSKTAAEYTQEVYEQDLKSLKNQQKKNLRDADEVTQLMVLECQELLSQFGIPYIIAASEAESQCAKLVQLNLVDGIVTDDSDVFLFGGTRVYRNMFNAAKTVECYVLSDLEREFDLDRDRLIRLAYLLGSDYTEGIKRIGPVLAVELISEFSGEHGLNEFRDYVDRVQAGRETEEDKASAFRRKFRKTAEKLVLPDNFPSPLVRDAYVKPEVDEDASTFEWGTPDVDALRAYLMKQCNWRQEYTDSQLLPVIKDMNMKQREGTQRNLTSFFSGSVGTGAAPTIKKTVRSSRMHRALNSLRGDEPQPEPRKRAGSASTRGTRKRSRLQRDGLADDNEI